MAEWACSQCTFINSSLAYECEMCQNPAPSIPTASLAQVAPAPSGTPVGSPITPPRRRRYHGGGDAAAGGVPDSPGGGGGGDLDAENIADLSGDKGAEMLWSLVKKQLDEKSYIWYQPCREGIEAALQRVEEPEAVAFARSCFKRIFEIMLRQQG